MNKFNVGDIWLDDNNIQWKITSIDSGNATYPIRGVPYNSDDYYNGLPYSRLFTLNGRFNIDKNSCKDLVMKVSHIQNANTFTEDTDDSSKKKRHKYADVIHAWAEGEKIQFKTNFSNGWNDYINDVEYNEPPDFNESIEWRIKPKTKVIRYRNGLFTNAYGSYIAVIDLSGHSLDNPAEHLTGFVKWLGESQEIEVEV